MTTGKTLIIDCDGVLYPSGMISLRDFVAAMKETYRSDLHVDAVTQRLVSEETIRNKKLGMFNYIKAMCEKNDYSFETFCRNMIARINYDVIKPDELLWRKLLAATRKDEIVILTDNHRLHLDKVLRRRFGKSIFDLEDAGIKCYDIVTTERNGIFRPKYDKKALSDFAVKICRQPENCIVIDDTFRNIEAAYAAGMSGVLINHEHSLMHFLNSRAHLTNINDVKGRENG